MVTEELRRSGRARKQIKTYAEEQGEQIQQEKAAAPKKAPRKKRNKAQVEEDDEAEAEAADEDDEFVEEPPKKRAKKATTSKTQAGAGQEWISEAAEDRIARQQSRVKKLAPGKEEKRLKR